MITLAGALALACSKPAVPHDAALSLTTATLATLVRAAVPMTLFDARTGAHDDGRRIPGAVAMAPDASPETIARAAPKKDGLVISYCKDPQCPNFAMLATRLRSMGYTNVLEAPEGIEGWARAGLQITHESGTVERGKP